MKRLVFIIVTAISIAFNPLCATAGIVFEFEDMKYPAGKAPTSTLKFQLAKLTQQMHLENDRN